MISRTATTSLIAVLVAVSGFFTLSGCRKSEAAANSRLAMESGAPPPEEKPRYTVERGSVTARIQFLGNIAPIDERHVFFRTDGRVRTIFYEEGDGVKAGSVLAELEMTDLLNQINQAKVSLEKAQLRLEEIRDNILAIAEAEAELSIKKLKQQQAEGSDPTAEVDIAQANLDKSALLLEQARINDQLAGHKEPSFGFEQARLDHRIAEANFEQALQDLKSHRYQLAIMSREIELAELKLRRLREYVDPQATTEVKLAELTVKRLEDQASMHRIYSPIDAEVMSLSLYAGNAIRAYQPVIIVANPSRFEISAFIVSSTLMKLHEGQKAVVQLVDHPGRVIDGWIRRLPYIGQRNTTSMENADQSTRIQFTPLPDLALKVGDLARTTIVLEERKDVLWLPPEAIRVYQGRRFVVIEEQARRRRVDVKIGLKSEDRVEIEEGLEQGQIVIGQ